MAKRILCAIITFSLMFGCFLPARAVPVGAAEEELKDLYEMKYGYALDCVMIAVFPAERDRLLEKLQADAQVKSVGMVLCRLPSPDYFEKVKNGEAEFDQNDILIPHLNTSTKEALDAFIARYENEPGVASIEYDGLGYIPEALFAVRIDLRLYGEEGLLEPIYEYTPADFSYAPADSDIMPVKTVYVSGRTGMGLTDREKKQLEEDPDCELLRSGIPQQLVLETQTGGPAEAAALVLELLDFENSALFSDAQKEMFRLRLKGVEVISYNGITLEQPLVSLVKPSVLQIWVGGNTASFRRKLRVALGEKAGMLTGETFFSVPVSESNLAGASFDRRYTHYYMYPEMLGMELSTLAEILNAMEEVVSFKVSNVLDAHEAIVTDLKSAYLLTECAYCPGDLNGDKKVNAADARLVLRSAVGIDTILDTRFNAADTNADGKITAGDARTLLRIAVGLDAADSLAFSVPVGVPLLLGPFYMTVRGNEAWLPDFGEDAASFEVNQKWATLLPEEVLAEDRVNPYFYSVKGLASGSYTLRFSSQDPAEGGSEQAYTVRINVTE